MMQRTFNAYGRTYATRTPQKIRSNRTIADAEYMDNRREQAAYQPHIDERGRICIGGDYIGLTIRRED